MITKIEAANIAQQFIEDKLAKGDVTGGNSSNSYGTVNYSDASFEYSLGEYTIKCRGTCWEYNKYGETLDKYRFEVSVCVNEQSSNASTLEFLLTKI